MEHRRETSKKFNKGLMPATLTTRQAGVKPWASSKIRKGGSSCGSGLPRTWMSRRRRPRGRIRDFISFRGTRTDKKRKKEVISRRSESVVLRRLTVSRIDTRVARTRTTRTPMPAIKKTSQESTTRPPSLTRVNQLAFSKTKHWLRNKKSLCLLSTINKWQQSWVYMLRWASHYFEREYN